MLSLLFTGWLSSFNWTISYSQFSHLRLPSQETPSILILLAGLGSSLYSVGVDPTENTISILTAQQYFDCCLCIHYHRNVFTEPLPSNECLLWLHYSSFQASCHSILGNEIQNMIIIVMLRMHVALYLYGPSALRWRDALSHGPSPFGPLLNQL
jgi:hypothetical protein